jgi:hypothetical protein
MKKIEIEVYSFDELSEEAKQKAIQQVRESDYPYDYWDDDILDNWKEKLENLGYPDAEIAYSGFWSQGDGASFTCTNVNVEMFLERQEQTNFKRLLHLIKKEHVEVDTATVKRDKYHYYVHYNTITANVSLYFTNERVFSTHPRIEEIFEEVENAIQQEIINLSQEIYSELNKEYDSLTTDEAIIGEIKAGEHEFYKNGTRCY